TLTGIPAQFDQIRTGMSEKEIEELLGGPRGVHDTTKWYSTKTPIGGSWSGGHHSSIWYFPECAIEVVFRDGMCHSKEIEPPLPVSPLERPLKWCKQSMRLAAQ